MITAVFNNKGGTGKSTTAVNLAAAIAMQGSKVLIVDLDAQANATAYSKLHRNQPTTHFLATKCTPFCQKLHSLRIHW